MLAGSDHQDLDVGTQSVRLRVLWDDGYDVVSRSLAPSSTQSAAAKPQPAPPRSTTTLGIPHVTGIAQASRLAAEPEFSAVNDLQTPT
jgi:hypothetical protein